MACLHHVSDELIVAYEAGSLAEGWSLAVATHLALCPACRGRARFAASVGGALIDSIETKPIAASSVDRVMSRIAQDTAQPAPPVPPVELPADAARSIPEPLRRYVGGDLDRIAWKRLGVGAHHFPIPTADGKTKARLLKIPAGAPVPEHGHRGLELTVVLSGSLIDGAQTFRRGDVEEATETLQHQPVAGPGEPCVCLAITDAPLRFKSLIVRLAQPFLGI